MLLNLRVRIKKKIYFFRDHLINTSLVRISHLMALINFVAIFDLMFNVRKHIVEIDIKYGDGIIEIIYRDSKNMLYKSEDEIAQGLSKKNTMPGS